MTRSKKKKTYTGKTNCISGTAGEITLNDFANVAIVGKGRLKKPASNVKLDTDVDLDEEALDVDCNINFDGRRCEQKTKVSKSREGENVYPLDIWCILSTYIRPEDIGRFAGICQSSNYVVNCSSFWFKLYKRYYKPVKEMPRRLQPECMTRLFELKACVVRSLYYTYPPFAARYFTDKSKAIFLYHPCISVLECQRQGRLTKRRCILAYRKSKDSSDFNWQFEYCFILKRENPPKTRVERKKNLPDLLETLDNIHANEKEGRVMLQVMSRQCLGDLPVLGLILSSVEYEHNMLTITFSSGINSGYERSSLTFNYVDMVRIHDWWSPYYPHSDGISSETITCQDF